MKRFGGSQISAFFLNRARNIRANLGRASQALQEAQNLAKRAAELTAGLAVEKQRIGGELAAATAYHVSQIEVMARENVAPD